MKVSQAILKRIRIVLSILAVFLIAFLLVLLVIYFSFNISDDNDQTLHVKEYQMYQVNPLTNETAFSVISSDRILTKNDEFVSYERDDGFYVLISKIGSNEFKCTGSCYCEYEETRKSSLSSPILLRNGIMFLLVSVTSHLAYQKASQYFEETCEDQFSSSDCPSNAIKSEVDVCTEVYDEKEAPSSSSSQTISSSYFNTEKGPQYICRGHCTPNKFFYKDMVEKGASNEKITKISKDIDEFNCKKLEHEGIVNSNEIQNFELDDPGQAENNFGVAFYYLQNYLGPYCRKTTQKKVVVASEKILEGLTKKKRKKVLKEGGRVKVSYCDAGADADEMETMCRRISE